MKVIILFILLISYNLCSYGQDNAQEVNVKINHIAIAVTDLEESEQFYKNIIGLRQIPEPFGQGRHAWFDIGYAELHVIRAAEERTEHDRSNHLCFSVRDLDSFMYTLTSNGIEYSDFAGNIGEVNQRPDGVRQIYFTDPDGYWIEINDDFQ